MNPGLVVKLRPTGPWRIGPDSGARNRVDVIYHSDSLYSAVTGAMIRLGALEDWLDATARCAAGPAVRFSSCFPFQDEMGFIIPPRTIWPPSPAAVGGARVRWKSARFVPLGVVQALIAGQILDEEHWTVDGTSECLIPAGSAGPFRTGVRWNAAVDRLTGNTERHSTACLEFRAGAGLWTIVSFVDGAAYETWGGRVRAAFRVLADSGFGGEKSRGWGHAGEPEFVEGILPDMILPPFAGSAPPEEGVLEAAPAETVASEEPGLEPAAAEAPAEAGEVPAALPAPEAAGVEAAAVEAPVQASEEPATLPAAVEAAVVEMPPAGPAVVEPPVEAGEEPAEPFAPGTAGEEAAPPATEQSVPDTPAAGEPAVPPANEAPLMAEALAPREVAPLAAEAAPAEAAAPPRNGSAVGRNSHWLLSLFIPAAADAVDWAHGNYAVIARGGRVESPAASGGLKKQLNMIAEGSVVVAGATIDGAAPDVAPEGFPHPVFRAGFAVAIPLPGEVA